MSEDGADAPTSCETCGRPLPTDWELEWVELNVRVRGEEDEDTAFCSFDCMRHYWGLWDRKEDKDGLLDRIKNRL
jgi:hypothetical protein